MEKILLDFILGGFCMAKKVDNYFNQEHRNNFFDIDTDELMRLIEAGYKTEEIARELSTSKEQISMLTDEIKKHY